MYLKPLSFFFAACFFFLTSCGDDNGDTADTSSDKQDEKTETVSYDNMEEATLDEHGFPFIMMLPDEETAKGIPEFNVTGTGDLEIKVGSGFHIRIADFPGDIEALKVDLENDLLFTHTIEEETDNLVIYRSELPDGSKEFYHFYMNIEIDGIEYVIEDVKSGEFKRKHIDQMIHAVKSIEHFEEEM